MAPGDFYFEWSWKYTVRKIKERQERLLIHLFFPLTFREKRELASGLIEQFVPGAELSSDSDTDTGRSSESDSDSDSLELFPGAKTPGYLASPTTVVSGTIGAMPDTGISTSQYPTLHVTGFYSEYMYRKWYRRQADLTNFVADTGHIPRVTRLTEDDFIVCRRPGPQLTYSGQLFKATTAIYHA